MKLECPNCKFKGEVPGKKTPGSCALEIVLWLLFLPVGIIYSIWRLTQRGYACPQCDNKNVVKKGFVYRDAQGKVIKQ